MEGGAEKSLSPSILDYDVFELADRIFDAYPEPEGLADFGPYQVRERIDKGGMGEVWRAYDYIAGREVAIKIPRYLSDPSLRRRFAAEVSSQARLEHPFIARLYDHGVCPDGTPYFAMEFVDGKQLDEYCRDNGLPLKERVKLLRAVCEAVQYAHGLLVVHRDLKPSNILVKEDGTPKLLDFGIAAKLERVDEPARQTETEVRFTRAFAAPEQFRRDPVGVYTDVYALGVILYQMLTNRLPYDMEDCTPGQAELMVTSEREPERPSAVARRAGEGQRTSKADWNDLDVLCLRAMKKEVNERYGTVLELQQDVEHFLKREPLKARPDSVGYKVGKFARRNKWRLAAAVTILVLISSLTVFYLNRMERARNAVLAQAARTQRIQRFMFNLFGGDADAGPPDGLRVATLLDNGVRNAQALHNDPPLQGDLYGTLGGIYQSLSQLDRAESLFRLALDRRKSAFGADSQEVAESLMGLSAVRNDQAQFADAELLGRQALDMLRRKLPADHPDIGKALTNLGAVLFHAGKWNEGVKVLEPAVQILSKSPADQADLIESLTQLANCQSHLGHNVAADSLFLRILSLDRPVYGDHHAHVAEDLSNLSQSREGLGKYADAEKFEHEAFDIERNWYGTQHPETALQLMALGKTLIHEGKYDEGANALRAALAVQEQALGKMHPFVQIAVQWLGVAALKKGNLNEAEADFQRAAEITHSVFGDDKAHHAAMLTRFGELAQARKDYPKAEALYRDAVRLFSASPNVVLAARTRIELGDALVRERRFLDAEPELLSGYKIVTSEDSFAPDSAADARQDLAIVYEALKMPAQAAKFRAELGATQPQSR